ncbi:Adult-specific rigid cuticular protein 12.6, partial [Stegodyphus mimosarum]
MIHTVLLFSLLSLAYSQYPPERGPPPQRGSPPQAQGPPPEVFHPRPSQNVVYKPASVHYVNIGEELAGDYKFGYDTGKGTLGQSFREETRLPDGTVQGAYGYVDETGRQRIVKYTAGKDGFKAQGDIGPEGGPGAAAQAAPAPSTYRAPPPQAPRPAPQPAYAPPPQPAYRAPPAQPAYRAPPAQPAYRAPPAQPAYRAPPAQPAYLAPPAQPEYAPEPQEYAPRPRPQSRPQSYAPPQQQYSPQPARRSYESSPDYEDPN